MRNSVSRLEFGVSELGQTNLYLGSRDEVPQESVFRNRRARAELHGRL